MKGKGNLSFRSVKSPKGQQMHFVAVKKVQKGSGFVIYSYLKDSAFSAVKRRAKF